MTGGDCRSHRPFRVDPRRRRRAHGRRVARAGAAAGADHRPQSRFAVNPRVPVLRSTLCLRTLRPARCGRSQLARGCRSRRCPGTTVIRPGRRLSRHVGAARSARQTGRLPDVVSRYGGWGDRRILICGGPAGSAPPGATDHQRRATGRIQRTAGQANLPSVASFDMACGLCYPVTAG